LVIDRFQRLRIDILVNAISPGLIETEMTRHKLSDPQKKRNFVQEIPLGRPGHPFDIAGAAVFPASNDSDFITGRNKDAVDLLSEDIRASGGEAISFQCDNGRF
jgi:NAD(P)-dependent dehydrogenase (short-subunit alcohol dehydrogenase family)